MKNSGKKLPSFCADHHSCCYWARGNGWALMALTEVLEAWQAQGLGKYTSTSNTLISSKVQNLLKISLFC